MLIKTILVFTSGVFSFIILMKGGNILDKSKFKTAAEMKKMAEIALTKQVNIHSRVEANLKNIFEWIESFACKGRKEINAILLSETKYSEEIFRKVAEALEGKGYQTKLHLDSDNNHNIIIISWEHA